MDREVLIRVACNLARRGDPIPLDIEVALMAAGVDVNSIYDNYEDN